MDERRRVVRAKLELLTARVPRRCVLVLPAILVAVLVLASPRPSEGRPSDAALLNQRADIDVVSPLGVDASFCALRPALSPNAARVLTAVRGDVCAQRITESWTAVWLDSSLPVQGRTLAGIESAAELHREKPPFGPSVQAWLRQHGVPAVPLHSGSVLTVANAVRYERDWRLRFKPKTLQKRFQGRRRAENVAFVSGESVAWRQRSADCDRVVIPLGNPKVDGVIVMAMIGPSFTNAFRCIDGAPSLSGRITDVAFPRLRTVSSGPMTERLQRIGLSPIFEPAANPLGALAGRLAVSDIVQVTQFRLDQQGVSVRSSTVTDVVLAPMRRAKSEVIFDRPFIFRIASTSGVTIAIGMVSDVHG